MSKSSFWYGYLDAGNKSSAVLRDPDLDTGSTKTVYLFNLARNRILEYNLEVVEAKLRPLADSEKEFVALLESAFKTARRDFSAGRRNLSSLQEPPPPGRRLEEENEEESLDEELADDIETEPLDDEDEEEEV